MALTYDKPTSAIVDSVIDNSDVEHYHILGKLGTDGEEASAGMEQDKQLTIQEVCELLQVRKTYVYWPTHQKKIPHVKMQGLLRFRQSAMDERLESQEVRRAG